jgi:hypothetical protein
MNEFIKSFGGYYRTAQIDTVAFWAFPVGTVIAIWVMTTLGLKIFSKRNKLKTVFVANRAWIISSMIVAFIVISLICIGWSQNYFAQNPLQLSLLISLFISMLIPIVCLLNLRSFYTLEGMKEIINQPKTPLQLDEIITFAKKVFRANKIYFLIPILGFAWLFLCFYKGTNLISIVFDNSASMIKTSASDALSETFDKLQDNNEIVFTTLEGLKENDPDAKTSMKDIMAVSSPSKLKGGNVIAYNNPLEAKGGLSRISGDCIASPICEATWKSFLFIKTSKQTDTYKNKLLVIITDGEDNVVTDISSKVKFFFDDESFATVFSPDKVFIIDFSTTHSNPFLQRFQTAGCDIYNVENNKQAYLDALDNALQSFKNDWFLIYWTILIFSVLTIIGLLIQPKKII